jgi:formylglycine-generating enzyme required for sulfatase activity
MKNMIKYEISDKFENADITYPFNIIDKDDQFINDFWNEIEKVKNQIANEKNNKVRFIWIAAEGYCQTEVFLKKILQEKADFPVLYLHWLDYISSGDTVFSKLQQEEMGEGEFFIDKPIIKICVIDHAEAIGQKEQYFTLCRKFNNNPCIFIFLYKKAGNGIQYWRNLLAEAKSESDENLAGIIRSEKIFFKVVPYSNKIIQEIISNTINCEEVKNASLAIINTLNIELHKPYYFDLLIKKLRQYNNATEMPESFNDMPLLDGLYRDAIDGIIKHLTGSNTLSAYIESYYESGFVKDYPLDDQKRVPRDCYALAYGIIIYATGDHAYYKEAIDIQFSNYDNNIGAFELTVDINCNIVRIIKNSSMLNNKFILKDYFLQLASGDLHGTHICATVFNKCFEEIEESIRNDIFISISEQYGKAFSDKNEIRMRFLLGMEIGKLLPKMNSGSIGHGLKFLFSDVKNDYVLPKCNDNGIAIIPVTNFEYIKFVSDNGYKNYYRWPSRKRLDEIAVKYYKEIFEFIISTISENNRKNSSYLAMLLKGYDWLHYKQIAYLFSKKDYVTNEKIYDEIKIYYPESLSFPAKWDNSQLDDSQPFCNALQPVVCVNLLEARAYVKWLSEKINKSVRILAYDPDYLSVIGLLNGNSCDELRANFLLYIKTQHEFFNSVENSVYFYGSDDIEIKEPAPVAVANSKFCGLYDFIGNVFETQDTQFTYFYEKIAEERIQQLKAKDSVLTDYNCAGGGLQRTAANWPPEYMGQVPAFLRNQDIGFRIVVGSESVSQKKRQSLEPSPIEYSESKIYEFDIISNSNRELLDRIVIEYVNSNRKFDDDFFRSSMYIYNEKRAIFFSQKNEEDSFYKESIMLVSDEHNIFAYHLTGVSSAKSQSAINEKIRICFRKPKHSEDIVMRKKHKNQHYADWIDIIEIISNDTVDSYLAYPVNISNGFFKIAPRKVRRIVIDGIERKRLSTLINSYKIKFCEDTSDFKNAYFDKLKTKISVNFFLPDWIDIVDYIKHIADSMCESSEFDIKTIMAVISTIDTADLHECINKELLKKEETKNEKE